MASRLHVSAMQLKPLVCRQSSLWQHLDRYRIVVVHMGAETCRWAHRLPILKAMRKSSQNG